MKKQAKKVEPKAKTLTRDQKYKKIIEDLTTENLNYKTGEIRLNNEIKILNANVKIRTRAIQELSTTRGQRLINAFNSTEKLKIAEQEKTFDDSKKVRDEGHEAWKKYKQEQKAIQHKTRHHIVDLKQEIAELEEIASQYIM